MRLRSFALVLLLCLPSWCMPTFGVAQETYPELSNREIVETFLAIFEELDLAYQAYLNLSGAVQSMSVPLETSREALVMAAEQTERIATSVTETANALDAYEARQARRDAMLAGAAGVAIILSVLALIFG